MLRLRWYDRDFVLRYFVERSRGDMIEGRMVVEDFRLREHTTLLKE
jgi:hypothetical protein